PDQSPPARGANPGAIPWPANTPQAIRRLLTRCLQKDARRRLHDIADARIELEDTITAPGELARAPTVRWPSRLALTALLLAIATLPFLWIARHRLRMSADP